MLLALLATSFLSADVSATSAASANAYIAFSAISIAINILTAGLTVIIYAKAAMLPKNRFHQFITRLNNAGLVTALTASIASSVLSLAIALAIRLASATMSVFITYLVLAVALMTLAAFYYFALFYENEPGLERQSAFGNDDDSDAPLVNPDHINGPGGSLDKQSLETFRYGTMS
eukprot:m.64778 g.64778  ORF g.64778 m.64778 type:complete len:175 (+) comp7286_c1_seq1:1238-1762(+)